jgi:epoxyqueuosine reductase QueG
MTQHGESRIGAGEVKDYALSQSATLVGIASVVRFEGAPQGHHPLDLLPGARSVVSMAVKLPDRIVEWDEMLKDSAYMQDPEVWKHVAQDHLYGRIAYEAANIRLEQLGLLLSIFFEKHGYRSLPFPATYAHDWRTMLEVPEMFAPFSHRHAAVRAGLGAFGLNNLVLTPQFGPRVRFMSVLTVAELEPDPMLEKNVCLGRKCLACVKQCGAQAFTPLDGFPDDRLFDTMPSRMDKGGCSAKHRGVPCWGRCIKVCPVGRMK